MNSEKENKDENEPVLVYYGTNDLSFNEIKMIPVKSGTIAEIGFSESKLYAKFTSGTLYQYEDIDQEEFLAIKEAHSIGSKLKEVVKHKLYKKL